MAGQGKPFPCIPISPTYAPPVAPVIYRAASRHRNKKTLLEMGEAPIAEKEEGGKKKEKGVAQ